MPAPQASLAGEKRTGLRQSPTEEATGGQFSVVFVF